MEEQLYEQLVDSIVKNLQESPYELKKFVIDALSDKETIEHYNRTLQEWRDNLDETNDYEEWIVTAINQLLLEEN